MEYSGVGEKRDVGRFAVAVLVRSIKAPFYVSLHTLDTTNYAFYLQP